MLYAGRRLFAGSAKVTKSSLRRARQVAPVNLRRKRQPFTDLDQPIQIDGDQDGYEDAEDEVDQELEFSEPRVKFRSSKGKKALAAAAALAATAAGVLSAKEALADDEDEYEGEEEEYDEDEEEELSLIHI